MEGRFGVFLFSRIENSREFEIYNDNLNSLFRHLPDPEYVGDLYFIDDSKPEFQKLLHANLTEHAQNRFPKSSIVKIVDSGTVYHSVNKAWAEVKEEYVIFLLSDFRVVLDLPLATFHKAFTKYPDLYLIYLRVRGLFGYNDKQAILKEESCYNGYPEGFQETWFHRDEENRIFSLPRKLHEQQKEKRLSKDRWGTELIPRPIDENNTLWTPKLPAVFLESYPSHESFAVGGTIFRVAAVRPYLPLPKRYKSRPPADCLEYYFEETSVDERNYTGYVNLQAFTVSHLDPKRPLQNYSPEHWPAFLERNSKAVVYSGPPVAWPDQKTKLSRLYRQLLLLPARRRLKKKLEFAKTECRVLRSKIWRKIKGQAAALFK